METPSTRFEEYVSLMAQSLGHADRVEPFRGYCTGLMLPVRRKSVEPMAAHLSPDRVRSEHQRLHHFVADAPWSDQAVLDSVRSYVLERISRRAGSPEALIIDLCAVSRYVESAVSTYVCRGFEAVELHITETSYRDSSVHLNGRFTCWNFSFPAIGRAMPPARKDR